MRVDQHALMVLSSWKVNTVETLPCRPSPYLPVLENLWRFVLFSWNFSAAFLSVEPWASSARALSYLTTLQSGALSYDDTAIGGQAQKEYSKEPQES